MPPPLPFLKKEEKKEEEKEEGEREAEGKRKEKRNEFPSLGPLHMLFLYTQKFFLHSLCGCLLVTFQLSVQIPPPRKYLCSPTPKAASSPIALLVRGLISFLPGVQLRALMIFPLGLSMGFLTAQRLGSRRKEAEPPQSKIVSPSPQIIF